MTIPPKVPVTIVQSNRPIFDTMVKVEAKKRGYTIRQVEELGVLPRQDQEAILSAIIPKKNCMYCEYYAISKMGKTKCNLFTFFIKNVLATARVCHHYQPA